jgi:hypothetical protein
VARSMWSAVTAADLARTSVAKSEFRRLGGNVNGENSRTPLSSGSRFNAKNRRGSSPINALQATREDALLSAVVRPHKEGKCHAHRFMPLRRGSDSGG